MLAHPDEPDTGNSPDGGGPPLLTKRTSIMKKTLKAIGKVKPKFKKKQTHQMELMNSVASFTMDDAQLEDSSEEEEEGLGEAIEEEEEFNEDVEEEDMDRDSGKHDAVSTRGGTSDNSEGESTKSGRSGSHRRIRGKADLVEPGDQLSSPKDSSSERQGPNGSLKSRAAKETRPDGEITSPRGSGHSRRRGVGSRKSIIREGGESQKDPINKQGRSGSSLDKANDLKSQSRASISLNNGPATHLPDCIPEEIASSDADGNEQLKRCSRVFADSAAMEGYFARLQGVHSKEGNKPRSYNQPKPRNENVNGPNSGRELGRGPEELTSQSQRPSSPGYLKRFPKVGRTYSAGKWKGSKSKSEPSTKDEAAKIMLQLSSVLSANVTKGVLGEEDRPAKSGKSLPPRSFIFDETDEELEEFPEILHEKKTSIREIHQMVENQEGETSSSPKPRAGRKSSRENFRNDRARIRSKRPSRNFVFDESTARNSNDEKKNLVDLQRRFVEERKALDPPGIKADPPGMMAEDVENDFSLRRSASDPLGEIQGRGSLSDADDTSTTDRAPASSLVDGKSPASVLDMEVGKQPPPSLPVERLCSPRSRRGHRNGKNGPGSESSHHSSGKKPSSTNDLEKQHNRDDNRDGSHSKSFQHSRSGRGMISAHTSVDEDEPSSSRGLKAKDSPGSLQKKKSGHRRDGHVYRKESSDAGISPHSVGKRIPKPKNENSMDQVAPSNKALSHLPIKGKTPSLAESLERGKLGRIGNDGERSIGTDEGSEMFVKGKPSYSRIRSDASIGAPQLIIDDTDDKVDLRVKNI